MTKKGKKIVLTEKEINQLTSSKTKYYGTMIYHSVAALIGVALTGLSVETAISAPELASGFSLPGLLGGTLTYTSISKLIKYHKIKSGLESGEIKESDIKRR